MPRIAERHADIVRELERLVVGHRLHALDGLRRIIERVNGLHGSIAAPAALAVQHFGIRLLDMGRVGQHDAH